MKKIGFVLCMLLGLTLTVKAAQAEAYDAAAAKAAAQSDVANWMKYLPDDVFVAHLSIPGSHDTATGHGFNGTGIITASTHASQSQTQTATLDEQLAAGLRAFDFRPGLSEKKDYLNCNHGMSPTKLSMEQAFTKITDYLDAHPGEFFVIHLFRGNVYTSNAPIYCYDSEADKAKYNELFDAFFNNGKFADYIVDYNPMLKVKDMRGKMVIFRRDRIDFAHVAKAGNLSGWPSDDENWTEASRTSAVNASNPAVRGELTVTDVSSPKNDANLMETELNSIRNINAYARTQQRPNDAKKQDSAYKPLWVMCFTSGEAGSGGRSGYAKNAEKTNPLLTQLIKESDVKGPTGVVFSDWVLTDKYGSYNTMGVELIPTIIYNNFDYIDQFILDDELFGKVEEPATEIWDSGKTYFMRNAATGTFLSAGAWWGTHASLNKYGITVQPLFDESTGRYMLKTTLNNGYFGSNYYVDNTGTPAVFEVADAGDGLYRFILDGKAVGINEAGSNWVDGTTHTVDPVDIAEGDLSQLWELLEVETYYQESIAKASHSNGVDISYRIPGYRFFANDHAANDSWIFSTKKSAKKEIAGGGDDSHQKMLRIYNDKKGTVAIGWNASWTLDKTVSDLPAGVYTLSWKAFADNISDHKMTVNGTDVTSQIKSTGGSGAMSVTDLIALEARNDYTCSLDMVINDGLLNIHLESPTHSSTTAVFLDDFTLIYYGPEQQEESVSWTMGEGRYDAIILPFDVDAALLPAELSFYSTSEEFDMTDTEKKYHLLALKEENDGLKANTPYVVKRTDSTAPAVTLAEDNASDTYEFRGMKVESGSDLHTSGMLTGTLAGTQVEAGHYVLGHDIRNSYFGMHENAESAAVEANHAFVLARDGVTTQPRIYFEAPRSTTTGIENVAADQSESLSVYTASGVLVRQGVAEAKALDGLASGVYILSNGKKIVKL